MSSGTSQGGIGTIGVLPNNLLGGNFQLPTSNGGLGVFELALVQGQNDQSHQLSESLQITAQQVQLQSFLNETLSRDLPTQNQMVRTASLYENVYEKASSLNQLISPPRSELNHSVPLECHGLLGDSDSREYTHFIHRNAGN